MNDTILGLLSALAIYGLSALALPRSGWDTQDDPIDISASEEPSNATPASGGKEEDPQTG